MLSVLESLQRCLALGVFAVGGVRCMRAISARSSCSRDGAGASYGSLSLALLACAGFRARTLCGTSDPRRHLHRFLCEAFPLLSASQTSYE